MKECKNCGSLLDNDINENNVQEQKKERSTANKLIWGTLFTNGLGLVFSGVIIMLTVIYLKDFFCECCRMIPHGLFIGGILATLVGFMLICYHIVKKPK